MHSVCLPAFLYALPLFSDNFMLFFCVLEFTNLINKAQGKIQGIFTHIKPICDNLKHIIHLSENDILPIEILNSSTIIIQYLIKQILLFDIDYNDKSIKDFIHFSRKQYRHELNIINEFEENYTSSISWLMPFLSFCGKNRFYYHRFYC